MVVTKENQQEIATDLVILTTDAENLKNEDIELSINLLENSMKIDDKPAPTHV